MDGIFAAKPAPLIHWRQLVSRTPHPDQPVPFLDEAAIRGVLRMEDLIPAMERALIDFSAGRVVQPVRSIIDVPQHNARMGIMPAVYGDIMGAKLVNVYPGNAARGLPTHLALIAVFRADTGETLAVMDGRLITELRTAAVSAVATKVAFIAGCKKIGGSRQRSTGAGPRPGTGAGAKVRGDPDLEPKSAARASIRQRDWSHRSLGGRCGTQR